MNNIMTLHKEIQEATEMREYYLNEQNLAMIQLWDEQLDYLVREMMYLGD